MIKDGLGRTGHNIVHCPRFTETRKTWFGNCSVTELEKLYLSANWKVLLLVARTDVCDDISIKTKLDNATKAETLVSMVAKWKDPKYHKEGATIT